MARQLEPTKLDLPATRDRLTSLASAFFNNNLEFQADQFNVRLGLFMETQRPFPPFPEGKPATRASKLGLLLKHVALVDPSPVRIANPNIFPLKFVAYQSLAQMPSDAWHEIYLDFTKRRADAVWDDREEMLRCEFAFPVLARQSRATRRKNYDRKLEEVLLPADLRDYGSGIWDFHSELASDATYRGSDGQYYRKWRETNPEGTNSRIYQFDNLSDDYLKENFGQLIPLKGGDYVLLLLDEVRAVFDIAFAGPQRTPEFIQAPLLDTATSDVRLVDIAAAAKTKTAIFFHAAHGNEKTHHLPGKPPSKKRKRGTTFFVVDPQAQIAAKTGTLPAKDTKGWSDWDWFVEMVRTCFPDRVIELSAHGVDMINPLDAADREKLFLGSFARAIDKSKGPLKDAMTALAKRVRDDPDLLLFGRSAAVGENLRVIGVDGQWVYLYNTKARLTLCQRQVDFIVSFRLGITIDAVYQRTQHIIPFVKVLVWGATGVMGVGVLGAGGVVVRGGQAAYSAGRSLALRGRSLLVSTGINAATRKLAIEAYHKLRPQIIALLVGGFLHLVPNRTGPRSFVAGVLIGFSWDTLDKLGDNYLGLITSSLPVYSQYKTAKFIKKLVTTANRIENALEQLADKIDEQVAEELLARLERAPKHLLTAMGVLFGCLLLLDYENVKPLLEETARNSKQRPISRKDWEELAEKYLRQRGDALVKLAIDLAATETIDAAKEAVAKHQVEITLAAIVAVNYVFAVGPLFYVFLVAFGVPALIYDIAGNDQRFLKLLANLIVQPALNLDEYSSDEIERYGRFIGHLIGGIVIDRQIFKKGTALGDFREKHKYNPLLQRLVFDKIKHGIGLPLVKFFLSHVLIVLERLRGEPSVYKKKLEEVYERILFRQESDLSDLAPPEDRRISFSKLAEMLKDIDEILIFILKDLATMPDMDVKLRAFAARLDKGLDLGEVLIGPLKVVDWENSKFEISKLPSPEALYLLVSNLRTAVSEFAALLTLLLQPLRNDGMTPSIADLLRIIGIDIGSTEADAALAEDLESHFAPVGGQ